MKKARSSLLVSSLLLSIAAGLIFSNLEDGNYAGQGAVALSDSNSTSPDWPMFLFNAAHTSSPDDVALVTHDLLWRFNTMPDVASAWIIDSSPAIVGGVLYIGSDDGHFYALNSSNGNLLWNQTLGRFSVSSPAIVKGVVYVSIWEGRDYALNASSGEVIWNSSKNYYSSSSPAVVNGLHYTCSGNGSVVAKNATTGNVVWQNGDSIGYDSSPVVVNDTVYISENGVCALDAMKGTIKWTREISGSDYSSPAVADGIVFTGSDEGMGKFYALDAKTGATIWNYETGSSSGSTPTFAGGIVYFGSLTKGVFALNASTGALIWNNPASMWDSSFALAGGILYACNSDGIHALNAKTGTQIWLYRPSNTNINSAPAVANGVLYVRGGDCYLYAFGKATQPSLDLSPKVNLAGSTVSISGAGFTAISAVTMTFGGQPVILSSSAVDSLGHFSGNFQISPVTTPGIYSVHISDSFGVNAYANFTVVGSPTTSWPMFMHDLKHTGTPDNFVPTSNNTLWTYKLERGEIANQVASSAAVINGIVYTASENGYVYAFDAYTGVCYWKYSLPGMGTLSSPSVVDGVVYIGSDYGLFALNAYTGEKIWQASDRVLIMSSPAVSGGFVFTGSFVSQGTDEHAAYAFRASDGQLVWKFITSDYVDSSPAVVDSTVYINCDDGNLYALNAVNGALIWKFNTSLAYPFGQNSGSPAVVNGVVYTVNFYGNVIAINAANGQKIWNHSTERLGNGFTSPVVYNGIVFISTQNALYALDSSTGDEIWQCAVSSSSLPSVVNGVIYLTSSDGKIWAIDASTGTKTLHYSLEGGVRVQPAIARGVIYVGTIQGKFYAIGTPDLITPQPTPEPTPTNYPQPTPTPTPTINPTTQPTQTPTNSPTSQPTVKITPQPSQTPNPTSSIKATTDQGTQVTLSITGNITSAQISNVTITTNQAISTVTFNVTGPSGNTGFVNLTIPKNALSTNGAPTINIDGVPAQNQGFSSDAVNFYVWGETPFSTHQIKIVFAADNPPTIPPQKPLFQSVGLVEIAILALTSILAVSAITAITLNKRKQKKAKMG